VTIVDPEAAELAELQQLVRERCRGVFFCSSQRTSTAWRTGSSGARRADEKVWMYEAKIIAR